MKVFSLKCYKVLTELYLFMPPLRPICKTDIEEGPLSNASAIDLCHNYETYFMSRVECSIFML